MAYFLSTCTEIYAQTSSQTWKFLRKDPVWTGFPQERFRPIEKCNIEMSENRYYSTFILTNQFWSWFIMPFCFTTQFSELSFLRETSLTKVFLLTSCGLSCGLPMLFQLTIQILKNILIIMEHCVYNVMQNYSRNIFKIDQNRNVKYTS